MIWRLFFFLLPTAAYAQDRFAKDMFDIAVFFIGYPALLLGGACLVIHFLSKLPKDAEEKIKRRQDDELRRIEQERLDDLRDVPPYPPTEKFIRTIHAAYIMRVGSTVLIPDYLALILDVMGKIYTNDFIRPKKLPSLEDPFVPYDALFERFVEGLVNFTKVAPNLLTEPVGYVFPPLALYTEELACMPLLADSSILQALAEPFRTSRESLGDNFNWGQMHYLQGKTAPPEEEKKQFKEWEKYVKERTASVDATGWALHNSPFFQYATSLLPTFSVKKAFPLPPDRTRFEGTWMVAPAGSGKTNALLRLILDDLDKVARGEASIIVMDSSGTAPGRLLHYLSRCEVFAPGKTLANRLVVLEPSFDFPLALNLFDVDMDHINSLSGDERSASLGAARDMIKFVLGGLLGSELTKKQGGLFRYLTEAMMHIPKATVFTLAELLEESGYEKHREHILKLDPWAVKFFETRFRQRPRVKNAFAGTKSEMFWRIDAMLSDQLFRGMFAHPINKLDMFAEMQAGKVILINTNRNLLREDGMETFGRFMLSLIYQAAEKRLTVGTKKNLPVFVYLDECQDYIANEPRVITLLDQLARKNNIGFVFAHQRPNNLSPGVLDAVSSSAIRFASRNEAGVSYIAERLRVDPPELITNLPQGTFATLCREQNSARTGMVHFPLVDEKISLMSEAQYAAIQATMRERYSDTPMEPPDLLPPPDGEDISDDDEQSTLPGSGAHLE